MKFIISCQNVGPKVTIVRVIIEALAFYNSELGVYTSGVGRRNEAYYLIAPEICFAWHCKYFVKSALYLMPYEVFFIFYVRSVQDSGATRGRGLQAHFFAVIWGR